MGHNREAKNSWPSVHWPMIFLGTAAIAHFIRGREDRWFNFLFSC
jgi:hypothetical protein